jgi:hypothetical protein
MTQAIIDIRFAKTAQHDPPALERGKRRERQPIQHNTEVTRASRGGRLPLRLAADTGRTDGDQNGAG